eukprot:897080-Amphidinium_carterae.1
MVTVKVCPAALLPFKKWHWFIPRDVAIVSGRNSCQALPGVVVWASKSRLVVDPASLTRMTM